jgi:hypothetical protein
MEVVSLEDYLNTYENGFKNYKAYNKAMSLKGTMSQSSIGEKVGKSRGTVKDWIHGCKPHPVKAVKILEKEDLLPLYTNSQNFQAFGELYLTTLLSGSVTEEGYALEISYKDSEGLVEIGDYFKSKLNLDYRIWERKNQKGHRLQFKNGSLIGRMLEVSGLKRGKKEIKNPVIIPGWFSQIERNNDLLKLIFSLKGFFAKKTVGIYGFHFEKEEDAKNFSVFLQDILEEVTGIEFYKYLVHIKDNFYPRIAVSKYKDIREFLKQATPTYSKNLNNKSSKLLKEIKR